MGLWQGLELRASLPSGFMARSGWGPLGLWDSRCLCSTHAHVPVTPARPQGLGPGCRAFALKHKPHPRGLSWGCPMVGPVPGPTGEPASLGPRPASQPGQPGAWPLMCPGADTGIALLPVCLGWREGSALPLSHSRAKLCSGPRVSAPRRIGPKVLLEGSVWGGSWGDRPGTGVVLGNSFTNTGAGGGV